MSSSETTGIKRRKLRKGTFSCWECKRRKTRCEFRPASLACTSCQRRGLKCIGQDVDEEDQDRETAEERMRQVEDLVNQLMRQRNRDPGHASKAVIQSPAPGSPLTGSSLSSFLHSVLPSQSMATMILERGGFRCLPSRLFQLDADQEVADAAKLPPLSAHPVIFARKLITIAMCLLHPKNPTRDADKFLQMASRHVTSHDGLVTSPEGLETLTLEASYYISSGNLRAAWLTLRRALAIAQLMKLHSASNIVRGRMLWFGLVTGDRHLSLLLGLSMAVSDDELVAPLPGNAQSELKRMHTIVMGHLVRRNSRLQLCPDATDDEETQQMDCMLKQQVRSLPMNWWSFKPAPDAASQQHTLEDVAKLVAQLDHYYLVVMVHQPYIVNALCYGLNTSQASYSRTALPAAARETLLRFIALRTCNKAASYRGIDDKAVPIVMMLLLAHIEAHQLGRMNALEHQRPGDLRLVEEAITTYETLRPGPDDHTSMMKRLVDIEAAVADGLRHRWTIRNGCGTELKIPGCATLSVSRRDANDAHEWSTTANLLNIECLREGPSASTAQSFHTLQDVHWPTDSD